MTTATRQAAGAAAPDERERSLLTAMLRLRRFEEKAGMLYALGTLATPCPLGVGREGALAAVAATLEPGDTVLALGVSPALDIAFGQPMTAAFQRLQPACPSSDAPTAALRLAGEALRHTTRDEAIALAASRPEPVILVASRAGDLQATLQRFSGRVLPIVVLPSDRKDEIATAALPRPVRECDGADAAHLCQTLAAARHEAIAGGPSPVLAILTPPYAGHARDTGRRAASRRDMADPITICRQRLLAAGAADDAEIAAIEAMVRDEVTAAGRAVALACT